MTATELHPGAIAIVGMAGRFPGAGSPEQLWQNLAQGISSISLLSESDLLAAGVPPETLADKNYVRASGILDGIESFDAGFFRMTAREAQITDPQHRLFLETAWEALENAGYDPARYPGRIATLAGARLSHYLLNLWSHPTLKEQGDMRVLLGNDKDYIPTSTCYKLNLRGPGIAVQTACSSSLVAVHLACQSLLNGECDMALAGGVSIVVPQHTGAMYQEGGIVSPDGHCYPYDERAAGTVRGNGVGVVLLKRLDDALLNRDRIRAVIRGSAINNDGSMNVGYTAPSGSGQAAVIAEAQAIAGVSPETITYVEGHGTGTKLGDPIEVDALTRAFRAGTSKTSFCWLGSVKANIGHLDAAAGVTGLIKTVLSLEHRRIAPHPSFQSANPAIPLAESPFLINSALREWETNGCPRRAGVSSFGIGGTNAHVVLEEAPTQEDAGPSRSQQLVVLSAEGSTALECAVENLACHLSESEVPLADAAYTLAVGRACFTHRKAVVGTDRQEAATLLRAANTMKHVAAAETAPMVAFMFPGQGSQFVGMGREIYETEPVFKGVVDRCAEILQPLLGRDIRAILYPGPGAHDSELLLQQTAFAQAAIFTVEMALASLWMDWGVRPACLLGHSLGEYAAACVAGVFSLEDALAIVAMRGQLMEKLAPGAMSAVYASPQTIVPLLKGATEIAALNGPALTVISGSLDDIAAVEGALHDRSIRHRRLAVSRAFHSSMMDSAVERFAEALANFRLGAPTIPFISNVSGTWIDHEQAQSPAYWAAHLRQPVQFAAGVDALLSTCTVVVEVGSGTTLGQIVQYNSPDEGRRVLSTLPGQRLAVSSLRCMLQSLGRLWELGVTVDWEAFYRRERRQRVALPTYPFQRKRHWIDRVSYPISDSHESPLIAQAEAPTSLPKAKDQREVSTMPAELTISANDTAIVRSVASLPTLKKLVHNLTGFAPEEVDPDATFFQLGTDSLALVQLVHAIREELGVAVPFRSLFEELSTIRLLAEYIDGEFASITPEADVPVREEAQPPATVAHTASSTALLPSASAVGAVVPTNAEQLMRHQLDVMSQLCARQLETLRGGYTETQIESEPTFHLPKAQEAPAAQFHPSSRSSVSRAPQQSVGSSNGGGALSAAQSAYLAQFISSYGHKTGKSKAHVERFRDRFAEPRASMNFRMMWKELVYPIVADSSAGCRIRDLNGNEYIDIAMGFGVNLLGHSPDFLRQALKKQIDLGIQMGPESALAGKVAGLICELTGMERVAFCNSGTEAVMGALRLARAVTHRSKVVIFEGAYHGTFDGILANAAPSKALGAAAPRCPGVPGSLLSDIIVLPYGEQRALDVIRQQAQTLAAVLVEPVQSRRPDLQPEQFLRDLREITRHSGTALIFDEVITGFRCHPGGAQAWFEVDADLATYGKVIGGGMPIGVIAGRRAFLDAIDGGSWRFMDSSYPLADQTFFAGTFSKHPLAMASALAILEYLKQQGPQLQQSLTRKTDQLAHTLNTFFEQERVPLFVRHFGSLFLFTPDSWKYADLFFYHLVHHGLYLWEGRTCYLSTAHTAQDIEQIVQAVKDAIRDLRSGGFLPDDSQVALTTVAPAGSSADSSFAIPATDGQRQLHFLSQINKAGSAAFHDSVTLRLTGVLNLPALQTAAQQLIDRFEILRTRLSDDGTQQLILKKQPIEIPLIDFSRIDRSCQQEEVSDWLKNDVQLPFDLGKAPLIRMRVLKLAAQENLLVMTSHHVITDDRSYTVLLDSLEKLYAAACQGITPPEINPMQFREYQKLLERSVDVAAIKEDEEYWKAQFENGFPVLQLPPDYPVHDAQDLSTQRVTEIIPAPLLGELRRISSDHGVTLFMTLLTAYSVLLHKLSCQTEFAIGINVSQQFTVNTENLVGYHINPLSLLCRSIETMSFEQAMKRMKTLVLEANTHQSLSVSRFKKLLGIRQGPDQVLLTKAVFNLDRMGGRTLFHDLACEVRGNELGHSPLDLVCNVLEYHDHLEILFDFRTALFQKESVLGWLAMFRRILEGVSVDVRVPTADIEIKPHGLPQKEAPGSLAAATQENYELSRCQEIIWAGQQFYPDLPLFINAGFDIVELPIDPRHFETAIAALIDRCDALRMVVVEIEGRPRMKMAEVAKGIEFVDLAAAADPDKALVEWAEERSRVPLKLEQRLFDFVLLRLSARRFAHYVNLHHLISDAWSVAVVLRFMRRYYELAMTGRIGEAPQIPPFAEYLRYDRSLAQSSRCATDRSYWANKQAHALQPMSLYGRSTRGLRTCRVQRVSYALGPFCTERMNELGKKYSPGLSLELAVHNLFAAVTASLLHMISGLPLIGLGAPFHNRRGREDVVGMLMQIIPLRVKIQGEDRLPAIAQSIAIERINNLRHRAHVLGNSLGRPSYQVEFNFINARNPVSFLGTRVKNVWVHPGYGVDALAIQVHVDETGQYVCEFDCNVELLDEELRNRLVQDFVGLIDDFLNDPERQVKDYQLRSNAFGRQSDQRMPDETFISVFGRQAARTPGRAAVRFYEQALTYEEVDQESDRMAAYLRGQGIREDFLIGLFAERKPDFVVAMIGVMKSGAGYLPLDPALPTPRLKKVIEASRPELVLYSGNLEPAVAQLRQDLGAASNTRFLSFEESSSSPFQVTCKNQAICTNLAYCFYTSGSSGDPKGAMIDHAGMLNHLQCKVEDLAISANDVIAQSAPASFDVVVWQFLAALTVGASVVILDETIVRDPLLLLQSIENQGVTILEVVPSQLRSILQLLEAGVVERPMLTSLRLLFVMGEVLPPQLCRKWFEYFPHVSLMNAYGTTEVSDDVAHHHILEPPAADVRVPVGTAIRNATFHVLDTEMRPVNEGAAGELYVGGMCVGRGYRNDPVRTAEAFVPDAFSARPGQRLYKTGDLVQMQPGNVLDFLGRADFQVKIRGQRVELGEIEAALERHDAVRQAVVIAEECDGVKRLVAFLAADSVQETVLRAHLEKILPDYMLPSRYEFVDSLPLTSNGKVDRVLLASSRPAGKLVAPKPAASIEETMLDIWKSVLRVEHLDPDDNFFELGGDSILTIQIVTMARAAGILITPTQLFEYQTVQQLASVAQPVAASLQDQKPVTGPVPLTPIQHWFLEQEVLDRNQWTHTMLVELQPEVDLRSVEHALDALLLHHDALRLRCVETRQGWEQSILAPEAVTRPLVAIRAGDDANMEQLIQRHEWEARNRIDLAQGRLLQAVWLEGPGREASQLLLVVHHFATDGVSWRILLGDLHTAISQSLEGMRVALPFKTASYKQWASQLRRIAQTARIKDQLRYWVAAQSGGAGTLRKDFAGGKNTFESVIAVTGAMSEDATELLLRRLPQEYYLPVEAVLLAAFNKALQPLVEGNSLKVLVEGHGREEVGQDCDVSRTVGWFTAIYPLSLERGQQSSGLAASRGIRDQLRNVPDHGIGYGLLRYLCEDSSLARSLTEAPAAEVTFNYLGKFNDRGAQDSPVSTSRLNQSFQSRVEGIRTPLIDFDALAWNGRLQLQLSYSSDLYHQSTMDDLMQRFVDALHDVIREAGGEIPSTAIAPDNAPSYNEQENAFGWTDDELAHISETLGSL